MTGHLLGASGGIEAVACIMTILENKIAPTINYETPDPDCNLDYTPNVSSEREVNVAMSNTFWFWRTQRRSYCKAVGGLSLLKKFYRQLIWRFVHKDGQLIELQHALNYFFRNSSLLNAALTHKSKNTEVTGNYEQLEFLGDAVLDQVVSDLLIRNSSSKRRIANSTAVNTCTKRISG